MKEARKSKFRRWSIPFVLVGTIMAVWALVSDLIKDLNVINVILIGGLLLLVGFQLYVVYSFKLMEKDETSEDKNSGNEISEEDCKVIAYHEAGHAILTRILDKNYKVLEISIIPDEQKLGYTDLECKQKRLFTKRELENIIVCGFGGIAAEKLIFKETYNGVRVDLEEVRDIAVEIVAACGMEEEIGPISFLSNNTVNLGLFGNAFSEQVGEAVRNILKKSEKKAERVLRENEVLLNAVAQKLIENKKMSGEEFEEYFKAYVNTDVDADADNK